jgi:hypothetical protein
MILRKAAILMAAATAITGSSGIALVGLSGVAGAVNPSGTQLPVVVPTNPDPQSGQTITPGTPYASGQIVEVNIPANTALQANVSIKIIECADPGGLVANLPTSAAGCDTSTKQGDTIIPASDGSYDYLAGDQHGDSGYTVYSEPKLGGSSTITCGSAATPCVLWIGDNYNNFAVNQLWSEPFQVQQTASPGDDPGDGTPEVPLAIGLPLAAGGIFVGTIALRRRRAKSHAA